MRYSPLSTILVVALALWGCSERQQDPVATGPLYQFINGQSVKTTTNVTVHSAANNFSSSLGPPKPAGAVGTIQASPGTKDATGDNTIYWQVAFSGGPTGWVSGVFLTPAAGAPPSFTCNHYVAPGGGTTGLGPIGAPWSLTHALNGGGGNVTPGDTVCIRGGTYVGKFVVPSTLDGKMNAPIVFRAHPGENAIIEDNSLADVVTLRVQGDSLIFWGLEIWNSVPGSNRTANRPNLIWNQGRHNTFINLILHEGGVAVLSDASGARFLGNIIYNNGFQALDGADRGHGHALYLKNDFTADSVLARDNVMFNQFSHGIHAYTDPGTVELYNMKLRRNVSFNNGSLAVWQSGLSPGRNILVGGEQVADGLVVDSNMTYNSPDSAYGPNPNDHPTLGQSLYIGYQAVANGTAVVSNNYVVGGGAKVSQNSSSYPLQWVGIWSSITFTNNQYIPCPSSQSTHCTTNVRVIELSSAGTSGSWSNNNHYRDALELAWRNPDGSRNFAGWKAAAGITSNDAASVANPTVTKTFVHEVRSQGNPTGRANVVVYNWGNNGSVAVDLSGIVPSGRACTIRNVLALGTVLPGCTSGLVTITLNSVAPPTPVGQTSSHAPPTGTRFNVYTVDWIP